MRHRLSFFKFLASFVFLLPGLITLSTPSVFANEDAYSPTVALADRLNQGQPITQWEIVVDYEAADFIAFTRNDRLLIGSVSSGSKLGTPKYGDIVLYDTTTGRSI